MNMYLGLIFLILGLIIGSAINSLVWRLGEDVSLKGRSMCPGCRQTINWYDNIPVLSYLMLRGRCRFCRKSIPWHYPLVELAGGGLFLAIFFLQYGVFGPFIIPTAGFWLHSILSMIIAAVLLFSLVFDAKYYLISNTVLIPAAIITIGLQLLSGVSWLSLLEVLVLAVLFFGSQYILTNKKGIGEGDIWLGAVMALMFPSVGQWLVMIIISYFIGAAFGLSLIAINKKAWKDKLPLGVFLSIGGIITLFFGQSILSWYLGLLVL